MALSPPDVVTRRGHSWTWSGQSATAHSAMRYVRFLDDKLTADLRHAGRLMTSVYADHEASMAWQAILHERGWAAPAWPVEYGGCDWSLTQHYIFSRESTLAGAPSLSPMGIRMVAHAIIAFGTDEQKDFFLPRILTGEVFFCQGYSEPEAGSDLASLPMAAVDDGDDLVCTGSKIWTTHATEANWMFALVRTSRMEEAAGHHVRADRHDHTGHRDPPAGDDLGRGDAEPGVLRRRAGAQGQRDRRDRRRLDRREVSAGVRTGRRRVAPALQVMAEEIATAAAEQPGPGRGPAVDDPAFARKLADARIRTEVLEILEYRTLAGVAGGGNPGAASSMLKVLATELSQAITELAMETAGPRGRVYQPHATCRAARSPDSTRPRTGTSAGNRGRRWRRCGTSTTARAPSTPAAMRFSATFSPKQRWDYSYGLHPQQGTGTAPRRAR